MAQQEAQLEEQSRRLEQLLVRLKENEGKEQEVEVREKGKDKAGRSREGGRKGGGKEGIMLEEQG